jgi:subtilisin family serine protease
MPAEHGAQIINMSFAGEGSADRAGIAATAARGILMVAAAGNAGAKSPPLYPGRQSERHCGKRNRRAGRSCLRRRKANTSRYRRPGRIFLPAPDEKYQITSGTSFPPPMSAASRR